MNTEFPFDPNEVKIEAKEDYRSATMRILGNFHAHFPIGNYPNRPGGNGKEEKEWRSLGNRRHFSKTEKNWDIPRNVTCPKKQKPVTCSELFFNQTPAEFYATLDATIKELGIPMTKFIEARNRAFCTRKMTEEVWEQYRKEWWKIALPVYVALRGKGYSKCDLIQ